MYYVDWLRDFIAAGTTSVLIFLVGILTGSFSSPVLAQLGIGGEEITNLELILRESGAFAVILIILFFYRRDYRDVTQYKSDQVITLSEIVTKQTEAQVKVEAALREQIIVTHGLKRALELRVPISELTSELEGTKGT